MIIRFQRLVESTVALGREGEKNLDAGLAEQVSFVSLTEGLLESTAEYRWMSVPDAAQMVNTFGNISTVLQ